MDTPLAADHREGEGERELSHLHTVFWQNGRDLLVYSEGARRVGRKRGEIRGGQPNTDSPKLPDLSRSCPLLHLHFLTLQMGVIPSSPLGRL